jgi:hypothetical protein
LAGTDVKVHIAFQYRIWMLALLPATLGLGTAALWIYSLNWPCSIDDGGLNFRYRRKVPWRRIRKLIVMRGYLDDRAWRIDIHHRGGVCRIPLYTLQEGDKVGRAILEMFKQKCQVPLSVNSCSSRSAGDIATTCTSGQTRFGTRGAPDCPGQVIHPH